MNPDVAIDNSVATFPKATIVSFYSIGGKLFRKATLREGAQNPAAIRAVAPGKTESVCFFLPAGVGASNEDLAI